jgi:hypothetical protein
MKFEKWFKKQFDGDPCPYIATHELWRKIYALRKELSNLETIARQKRICDLREYAARLAWNLSDKYKKGNKV